MVLTGIQEDICVVRRDGSGFRQLTDDPAKDRGVSWTTDGRIVFYSSRSGNYEAWTVRPDGSGLEPLTKNSKHAIWNPRVSPDGKRLAYNNAESAYLVDLQVESIQREPVEITPLDGEPGRFWHSYWSPDGKWLVGNDDQAGIVAYHVETGEYRRYTDSGEFAQGIPGTSLVLYHDNDQLWALDKSSGESQQVELGTLDVHFLRWVHFDPDTGMLIYLVWQEESDIWMAELE
jgi:Tol biopolymer transport system component